MFKKLFREPIVHFGIGSLLIFGFFSLTESSLSDDERSITLSSEDIDSLEFRWKRTWKKDPTDEELETIISSYLRNEILYREGLRLGLDRDDAVVKNRLVQKMLSLIESEIGSPNDADLQAWAKQNAAKYTPTPVYSLRQIYLGRNQDLGKLPEILNLLNDGKIKADTLRVVISLPVELKGKTVEEIIGIYGQEFSKSLSESDQGRWLGPIRSSFGEHFVFIDEIKMGKNINMADDATRQRIANDWFAAKREELFINRVASLKEEYDIQIDR